MLLACTCFLVGEIIQITDRFGAVHSVRDDVLCGEGAKSCGHAKLSTLLLAMQEQQIIASQNNSAA